MGERKKPSSLRARIDRTRSAYERETNPAPIIIGVAFFLVVGIVLYYMMFNTKPTPAHRQNKPPAELLKPPANPNYGPASGRPAAPRSESDQVYTFVDNLKRDARDGDIEGALAKLQQKLGQWPKYDAEIYVSMAVVVGNREGKVQGEAARQMWAAKAGYYQKALDKINSGGKFAYGTQNVRLQQLKEVLRVARRNAGM